MKKKFLAVLLALVVGLTCVFPVYGDSQTYIQDNTHCISDVQLAELNETAESLRVLTGARAYFSETSDDVDASEYAETAIDSLGIDSSDRAILLAVTESQWSIQLFGDLRNIYSEAQLDALWASVDEDAQRTGYALASAYYAALPQFLDGISASDAVDSAQSTDTSPALLVDNANLLTESERRALLEQLTELRSTWNIEVSIVTTPGIGEKSLQDYTDDFYDHNGYGCGSNHDGVMLLVNMGQDGSERACHITAVGAAISIFTDARRDQIAEDFLPDLKDGRYADAFRTFADDAGYYIFSDAHNGNGGGNSASSRMPFNWRFAIPVSVIIGLIVAWIAVAGMKRKLKSVNRKTGAADYTRPGSMNITDTREFFLYSHIDRRERPKDDDHGGSTIHTSSSGTEHSGSSYKF